LALTPQSSATTAADPPGGVRRAAPGATAAPDVEIVAPQSLRALVRSDEFGLTLLAAFVGVAAGLLVIAMSAASQEMHVLLFDLLPGQRLSASDRVDTLRALLVPSLGGLIVGLTIWAASRWRPRRAVDPIEANALYGGRMSVSDSVLLMLQTVLSNGFGASVGLEAGYTQIGSATASRVGRSFVLRRNDLRILVGCGAAAAIAAAFDAPLTGAFYAFELIIGTYSLATLAPVVGAAIASVLTVQLVPGGSLLHGGYEMVMPAGIEPVDYIAVVFLGIIAALAGIVIMRGVTLTENLFRVSRVPAWARPGLGGLVVGLLALISPAVLSGGHGAVANVIAGEVPLTWLAILLLLKSVASAVSIGSGFRGGLFFASLLLGAMLGKLFAGGLAALGSTVTLPAIVGAIVGMTSFAVAIVGGPLTMTFLALETTGSLRVTAAVLVAAVVTSLTVRRIFGYSFATWRFHLRGEAIRSAVDIGWMRNLTVGRMMRRDVRTVRANTTLAAFRRDFPLGAATQIIAVDDTGRYAGIILLAEAHAEPTKAEKVSDLLRLPTAMLLPQMTVKEAVAMFGETESDALAVVDALETRRVLGLLTEQHTMRRYTEELERRRQELFGE